MTEVRYTPRNSSPRDIPGPELLDHSAIGRRERDANITLDSGQHARFTTAGMIRDVVAVASQLDQALTGLDCAHHPPNPAALSFQWRSR